MLTFIIIFTCLTSGSPSWPLGGNAVKISTGWWVRTMGGWVPHSMPHATTEEVLLLCTSQVLFFPRMPARTSFFVPAKASFCMLAGSFCMATRSFFCMPVMTSFCFVFCKRRAQSAHKRPVQKKKLASAWKKAGPNEGLSWTSMKEGPGLLWHVVWKMWQWAGPDSGGEAGGGGWTGNQKGREGGDKWIGGA